jgi:hypothetical protein
MIDLDMRASQDYGSYLACIDAAPAAILAGMSTDADRSSKPALEGLEDKWTQRWAEARVVQV